jgi:hypothetical protein
MTDRPARLILPALILALILMGCQSLRAAAPTSHTSAQPESAFSLAVDATDGSLLKAAGGLFRSTDRGASWQPLPLTADLHPETITQVATSAAAPSSVYAAGPGRG